jgi:ABC-2 type transport system ATP-binding protein
VSQAVVVDELRKSFGDLEAVRGISFEVEAGELFGFLGPNGAGKTTSISMLCTLLTPTSGRAVVNGYDVVTQRDLVRRSIGLVFQDTTLDDILTAAENLRFHAVLYGTPHAEAVARMDQLLDMVGLRDRARDKVQTFSGGMKRRLEIARGLLHAPQVLFLDEPTIGLDPQTRNHIWAYVDDLRQRESTTMFLTTHYMDEAEQCDRIAIIDEGVIVAIDTPERLKASVGADAVTVATNDDVKARQEVAERLRVEGDLRPEGLRLMVENGEAFVPRLFEVITVGITNVNVRRPTLDDVFIKYTGRAIRDVEAGAGEQLRMNQMIRAWRSRR